MKDLFLLLVFCLIMGIGFVIADAVGKTLDELRQKSTACTSVSEGKHCRAKNGGFRFLKKAEQAVCYMEMCDPDPSDWDEINTMEQF